MATDESTEEAYPLLHRKKVCQTVECSADMQMSSARVGLRLPPLMMIILSCFLIYTREEASSGAPSEHPITSTISTNGLPVLGMKGNA